MAGEQWAVSRKALVSSENTALHKKSPNNTEPGAVATGCWRPVLEKIRKPINLGIVESIVPSLPLRVPYCLTTFCAKRPL